VLASHMGPYLTLQGHEYWASVPHGMPVHSPDVAGTCTYPQRDGQAEFTWVTG